MCNEDEEVLLLTDDDGVEHPYQMIDEMELDGCSYALLAPVNEDEDDVLVFELLDGDEMDQVLDERLVQRIFDVYRSSDEDYEFCDAE